MDAGAGLPGARPELKSKPQASQNCPDRPVPQFGHGCAPGGADSGAVPADLAWPGGPAWPGDLAWPGDPAWPGGWAVAADGDAPIRIPHVSQ